MALNGRLKERRKGTGMWEGGRKDGKEGEKGGKMGGRKEEKGG